MLQRGLAASTGSLLESSTSCLPRAASPAVGRDSVLVGTVPAALEPSPWLLLAQEKSDPRKQLQHLLPVYLDEFHQVS